MSKNNYIRKKDEKNKVRYGILFKIIYIRMRVDDLNLAKVDLIHLDIEHCEYYALLGAMNTIKTHRPVLFIERGITDQIKQLLVAENYMLQGKSGYADYIWTYTGE